MKFPRIPRQRRDMPYGGPEQRQRRPRSLAIHRPITWMRIVLRILRGVLRLRRGRF